MIELTNLNINELYSNTIDYLLNIGYKQINSPEIDNYTFYSYPQNILASADMIQIFPGCSKLIVISTPSQQGIVGASDTLENRITIIKNLTDGATDLTINLSTNDNHFFIIE